MQLQPIFFISGQLLTALALSMLGPIAFDFWLFDQQLTTAFGQSFFIILAISITLILACQTHHQTVLRMREAFLFTTCVWLLLPILAALPFYFGLSVPFVDAYFETVSALTTTGATIFERPESLPKSILLWRAILQWFGGTGIVLMAIILFPILRVSGITLLRSEFSDRSDKILPRVSQMIGAILMAYSFFTVVCWCGLMACGMPIFEAFCHATATVSTGGMTVYNESIGVYNNLAIEIITMIFMFIGGSTFMLFVRWWKGDHRQPWQDPQLRFYAFWIMGWILILTFWHTGGHLIDFFKSLRICSFTVISMSTSTGFAISDYTTWHSSLPLMIMFILMCIGGCTGSTTGGIKIFRLQVLGILIRSHLRQIRRPYSIILPMYHGQKISHFLAISVFVFFLVYIVSLMGLAMILAALGLDLFTSVSAAAASLGNTGPGLTSAIGPMGSYHHLTPCMKILISLGMIIGRLEFITILMLWMPSFWKN